MSHAPVSKLREPLVSSPRTLGEITGDVADLIGKKPGLAWWVGFAAAALAFLVGLAAIAHEMVVGIGVWGLNRTVGWGFDITNFVFWVGIGHAGTLISAVLFLFRQKWRTSINRAAEAMTIFAVMCAALFPLIHMGRPWYFYWILPYPNNRGTLWVNFRSPLLWDFFAISTYFTISLVFWYIGMIPDLATLRDRTRAKVPRAILSFLSHGWNGSARVWHRYETVYALLALLATPLVVSVHSIVSFDFCTSVIPGWHTTIFPPYFVVGAIFGGFAMVLALLLITRKVMRLEHYITAQHLNWMCKILLLASMIMGSAYGIEFFIAWYSGNQYELAAFMNRAFGPYRMAYWSMVFCNVVVPQVLWFSRARRSPLVMMIVCISITIGMWLERFVIIVTSLHRDFLPSSWSMYSPTWNEVAIMVGMFGLFFSLFLLFTRALPIISITEIKGVRNYARPRLDPAAESAHALDGGTVIREDAVETIHQSPGYAARREEVRANGRKRRRPPTPPMLGGLGGLHLWPWRRRRAAPPPGAERFCVAYFDTEDDLIHATTEARRRGYPILDAFSPYAVHGLPKAMGLGPSRLTWIGFWAGILGLTVGLVMQVWTSAYDWPLRVGGQPFNSWPVFIPVSFELTVLFAGLMGVGALFARTGMWPGNKAPRLQGVTDDRFALALLEVDASVELEEMTRMLSACGATEIREGDELT